MKISFSSEVAAAIEENLPVVALESTVIAHGLPYPQNLETASRMEEAVRAHGAVPATIAVLNGVPTIGVSSEQLKLIATSKDFKKISIRDLPLASAKHLNCATTVATTMFFAAGAGIRVFATGGIGGIHRGDRTDVSADLSVIASIPMVTVCAGAKIVLDLPATREWLETNGVCVVGWQTDEFPAFYSRKSGLEVDGRVDSIEEVLDIVKARDELELHSAILLTVPVPENDEIPLARLEEMLEKALIDAESLEVSGKETTPFLLSRISELSNGETIDSNIALLLNNAGIAARVAVGLARN